MSEIMKWTDDFLDKKRLEGDPLADRVLQNLIESKGLEESRKLFNQLITNIDLPSDKLPEEIQEFLRATVSLPSWLSSDDLRNSNLFFVDHGPKLLLLLYFKSLPLLYSDVKGAQVLVRTSRLMHNDESLEVFARRIAETGQFLLNVMSNDNFTSTDLAINSIRKVRLIHAAIRQFVSTGWEETHYGKIINQEDMALTLMTFSISLIDGLEQLLVKSEDLFVQAYFERWKAIGILLGVHPDLIPENIEEGRLLLQKILERQSGPSEAGSLLTKALVHFSKISIPGKIFDVTPESLTYFFNGKQISQHLGITKNTGCLGFAIPGIMASLFSSVEKLEGKSRKIEYVSHRLSKKLVKALVNYFDTYKQKNFRIPAEFQATWNLE